MKIFTYDDNFYALASCIYTAWEYSLCHKDESIKLQKHLFTQQNLFSENIYVSTDINKAKKVIESIKHKLSMRTYEIVYMAFLYYKDTGNDIYNYLKLAFKYGKKINYMSGEEVVMKLLKFQTAVNREIHSYKEVTRFKEVDEDLFLATIEPKHDILAELSHHFKDRMPSLNWIIIDCSRSIALIHPKDCDCYLQIVEKSELEFATKLNDIKNPYAKLWKTFFENISIKERENIHLQRQNRPLRKRKYMTEFIDEWLQFRYHIS